MDVNLSVIYFWSDVNFRFECKFSQVDQIEKLEIDMVILASEK